MSNKYNELWLEAANNNFEQAVEEDNTQLVEAIIKDVADAGFRDAAQTMQYELKIRTEMQKTL
jgi:hypothetical protein